MILIVTSIEFTQELNNFAQQTFITQYLRNLRIPTSISFRTRYQRERTEIYTFSLGDTLKRYLLKK